MKYKILLSTIFCFLFFQINYGMKKIPSTDQFEKDVHRFCSPTSTGYPSLNSSLREVEELIAQGNDLLPEEKHPYKKIMATLLSTQQEHEEELKELGRSKRNSQ